MKSFLIRTVVVTSLLASASSYAVRTERSEITSVFANATGGGFVVLPTTVDTNGVVCSSNGRYQINQDGAGARGHLATLLTAQASDAEVQLDVASCTPPAGFVSPVINNVILY